MLAALAAALRAAAAGLATVGRWGLWALDWAATLPGRVVGPFFGGGGSAPPLPSRPAQAPNTYAELAALVANRGKARALPGALPSDLEPRGDGTDPVSATVLAYAKARPADRAQVDLSALSPDQAAWLFRLQSHALERLAAAGGLVCGQLARGRAGGALSVDPCRRREPELSRKEMAEREFGDAVPVEETFAERVRRQRGGATALRLAIG